MGLRKGAPITGMSVLGICFTAHGPLSWDSDDIGLTASRMCSRPSMSRLRHARLIATIFSVVSASRVILGFARPGSVAPYAFSWVCDTGTSLEALQRRRHLKALRHHNTWALRVFYFPFGAPAPSQQCEWRW